MNKLVYIRSSYSGVEIEYTQKQEKSGREILAQYNAKHESTSDKGVAFSCSKPEALYRALKSVGLEVELIDDE